MGSTVNAYRQNHHLSENEQIEHLNLVDSLADSKIWVQISNDQTSINRYFSLVVVQYTTLVNSHHIAVQPKVKYRQKQGYKSNGHETSRKNVFENKQSRYANKPSCSVFLLYPTYVEVAREILREPFIIFIYCACITNNKFMISMHSYFLLKNYFKKQKLQNDM